VENGLGRAKARSCGIATLTADAGLSMPAIDDILDRGAPSDWAALGREVLRDPHGEVARKIVHLCEHHEMYGTSILWTSFVELARSEHDRGS